MHLTGARRRQQPENNTKRCVNSGLTGRSTGEVHMQCLESRDLSLDKLSAGSLRRLTPSLRRLAGEEH